MTAGVLLQRIDTALTYHKNSPTVLVDQTTATALALRMPVLTFTELELTSFALADMRAAQAATTPETKEEAKAKMRQVWEVKNDLDMGRDVMIAEIQRLQGVLTEMRQA